MQTSDLYDKLAKDVRFKEGLKACMNCGVCTAICPAADFYNYDPRIIVDIVQSKNEEKIEELLKGDSIWYCGECMSCKTRCGRGNVPGLLIMALRNLSMELGYFTESEKGRQQLVLKRTVGEWILKTGYCIYLEGVGTNLHPEQGPIWDWIQKNWSDLFTRMGANYKGNGPGILRKIPQESIDELNKIFDVTGGSERFEKIEQCSKQKAADMGIEYKPTGLDSEYIHHILTTNSEYHIK